jgi:dTDP-4-amino-4,6-dideoxygalactose transaminase
MNAGSNLRMTEFQAAILLGQLTRLEEQTLRREANAAMLNAGLSQIPGIAMQQNDPRVTRRSYHLFLFRFLAEEWPGVTRERFLDALRAEGVPVSAGYPYSLPQAQVFSHQQIEENFPAEGRPYAGQQTDYSAVVCPNSDRLCREACWFFQSMLLASPETMTAIVSAVEKIYEHRGEL